MKKIGVVSKVEYDGPGTKSIYIGTKEDNLIYISGLFITIYNEQNKILKQIKIETTSNDYNNIKDNLLYLGDIIEFDSSTNTIIKLSNYDDQELKEIDLIQKKYINRIEILKEEDFAKAVAKCSNIEEVKQVAWILKSSDKFKRHMDIVRVKNILENMSENLKQTICNQPIKDSLSNDNLKEILIRLDTKIKLIYDILCNTNLDEYNEDEYNENLTKLLNSYWLYKFYESVAKSKNIDAISNLVDLKEVKSFLTEKEMLPIKIKNKK